MPCGRSWTMQRKVPTLYGRRNKSTTSYHLCLLLLQSSSLQNPMFCRLPQELKLFIILFIFIFIIPSPLISLYSNLENYVCAHFCQLCSSFCWDEWLQLFKSVKTRMQLQHKNEDHKDATIQCLTPCYHLLRCSRK